MHKNTWAVIVFLLSGLLFFNCSSVAAQSVLPDPGTLKEMGSVAPGNTLLFKVTGKTSGGSLWGTDYYTTDSSLAMAAVHAGAIRNGETGVVKVTVYPGRSEYAASTRHGVTSTSWGSFDLSFTVEAAEGAAASTGTAASAGNAVLPNPGALKEIPDATPGKALLFEVTGSLSGGSVWGTKMYTTDSDLAMVTVHAGVLKPGQTGIIRVTFYPGQKKYTGSVKNGVKSSDWGVYDLSYMVERIK